MKILILHGIGGQAGIHWQQWLRDQLSAAGYGVVMPSLPNASRPERQIWLSEIKRAVDSSNPNELVIVGHSLGVTSGLDFIEQLDSPIKALVSVSGFAKDYGVEFNSYFLRERQVDFDKVRRNIGQSVVIYGDNDPYVSRDALADLAQQLGVTPVIIPGGGHLNSDSGYSQFPQLLEIVQAIK